MNVLSLFDGMGATKVAIDRLGKEVNKYYASEIDPYAMKAAQINHEDMISVGDIKRHKEWNIGEIDLIVGGSPCQDLSRVKKGQGLLGEKSKLFFEYLKAVKLYKPQYFLLENVMMNKESEEIVSASLGVEPVMINSGIFSAQDRERFYWTNIKIPKLPEESSLVFADVMEKEVDEKYFYNDKFEVINGPDKRVYGTLEKRYPNGKLKFYDIISRVYNPQFKMATLTAVAGGHQEKKVMDNGRPRKLTPLEYERLQTLPDGYTEGVSNSQRYKMLGNGFTVDVISHILKGME